MKALYRAITIGEDIRSQSLISGRSNARHSAKGRTTTPRFDDTFEKILNYPPFNTRTYKMRSEDNGFQFDRVKSFLMHMNFL